MNQERAMGQIGYRSAEYGGIDIADRLDEIATAHEGLRASVARITEGSAHEPVELPGWTRGHVLLHLADASKAFARQARYATDGRIIEMYDGGPATRDRRIEELHSRPVEWLRKQFEEGLTVLEKAWATMRPADWARPIAYRDSPLFATQLAWWREAELHWVDLRVGRRSEDWSIALASHLIAFLQPRLPRDVTLVAEDTGQEWETGVGTSVVVRGSVRSIAAWISGRPHGVLPTADGNAALPELDAWP
jgi:maleylpyruvate isomerase